MPVDPFNLSSDVVTGGSALMGLFLVYVGAASAFFFSYDATAQSSVRSRFQARAWIGVVGAIFSAASAGLAIIAKWSLIPAMAYVAAVLLIMALVWGIFITVMTALDIN